jgi:periplasmic divalent cation tolerance protein
MEDKSLGNEYIQVLTAVEKKEDALTIAKALLDRRLAGCVQIVGPITSTYWWKGIIETAQEWLCIIKSERSVYPELELVIKRYHTYDVPEITAFSIAAGSEDYLGWLGSVIGEKKLDCGD